MDPSRPFGTGAVVVLISPHDASELGGPGAVVSELVTQAATAGRCGFDGVLIGEHHADFPGYLPNPLQAAGWVLETTDEVWAAPAPLLLPLRPTRLVAEEVAWLAARFPGRVGLGVGMGAAEADFRVAGVPFEERSVRYQAALAELVALAGGDAGASGGAGALVARDPAVAALCDDPLAVVSATATPRGVRLAAAAGAGIMLDGLSSLDRVAGLARAYDGDGPVVLSRRVQVGEPPTERARRDAARYASFGANGVLAGADESLVTDPDPAAVAEQLRAARERVGADVVSLRPHLPGAGPGEVRAQLEVLGREVVPRLRDAPG